MLQTAWEDEEGMVRWRDLSCDDPDDFQTLGRQAWKVTDFERGDAVLMMPAAAEARWEPRTCSRDHAHPGISMSLYKRLSWHYVRQAVLNIYFSNRGWGGMEYK